MHCDLRVKQMTETINRNMNMVYRLAFSIVKTNQDAEDIRQEVMLRYIRTNPAFENTEHERAWFIRVTTNLCKNLWKTAWRQRVVSMDSMEEKEGDSGNGTGIYGSFDSVETLQGVNGFTEEAARVEGNQAEILVSFRDEGTEDYIHGMADMYDSYSLQSYGANSNVGGCTFMEYDEEQDKAYFQIDVMSTDGSFDTERLEFSVYQLLTDCQSITEEISLENILTDTELKAVSLNGYSGMEQTHPALEKLSFSGNEIDPRPGHLVMNLPLEGISPEEMKITGIAYMDGILRIQLWRGNFRAADRHMNIYMLDEAGNQINPDLAVGWQEEIADETISMEEFYFVIPEEQLETYTLMGEGDIRAGSIKGNWSITFDLN